MKRCPYCTEEVPDGAAKCNNCMGDLVSSPQFKGDEKRSFSQKTSPAHPLGCIGCLSGIVIIVVFLYLFGHYSGRGSSSNNQELINRGQATVQEKRLKKRELKERSLLKVGKNGHIQKEEINQENNKGYIFRRDR